MAWGTWWVLTDSSGKHKHIGRGLTIPPILEDEMSEIMVYLLKNSESPYPRGLMAKSASTARTPSLHQQVMMSGDLDAVSALEELDAFIAARRTPKPKKMALRFGRPSPHSPTMRALVEQIEE